MIKKLNEPDWPLLRLAYEGSVEPIVAIAERAGISRQELVTKAKLLGWALRSRPRRKSAEQITSTKAALLRLRVLVQSRIARLEEQGAVEDPEKPMNAAHVLVRTLEKVLELEERERKQRALSARAKSALHEQWREELAGRLARLRQGADCAVHIN